MANIPNIIIDTDPGQDDAIAILFAFGLQNLKRVQILALTCVAGNVPLPLTSKNARIICDWAKQEHMPVYAGADKPLQKELLTAEEVHGKNGLDGVQLHDPRTPLQTQHAAVFLSELLKSVPPKSIALCPVGPLTNIAQALILAPECAQGIKEIVIMGGTFFEAGNVTPVSDFNFYVDPQAAKIVLNSGVPITVVPLDVTHKACITQERIAQLAALPNENGKRLADILTSYQRFDTENFKLTGAPLHDPCAVAYCVYPELFSGKEVFVDIELGGEYSEGASIVDWWGALGKKPTARWITEVNAEGLFDKLIEAAATLP